MNPIDWNGASDCPNFIFRESLRLGMQGPAFIFRQQLSRADKEASRLLVSVLEPTTTIEDRAGLPSTRYRIYDLRASRNRAMPLAQAFANTDCQELAEVLRYSSPRERWNYTYDASGSTLAHLFEALIDLEWKWACLELEYDKIKISIDRGMEYVRRYWPKLQQKLAGVLSNPLRSCSCHRREALRWLAIHVCRTRDLHQRLKLSSARLPAYRSLIDTIRRETIDEMMEMCKSTLERAGFQHVDVQINVDKREVFVKNFCSIQDRSLQATFTVSDQWSRESFIEKLRAEHIEMLQYHESCHGETVDETEFFEAQ